MTPTLSRLLAILAFFASSFPLASLADNPPQDRTFNPQLFHPAVGPDEFLSVEPAQPLPHLNFSAGLWLDYARGGFTIYKVDPAAGVSDPLAQLQKDALSANLVLSLGLWNRLQIGLGIPMTLYQGGDAFSDKNLAAPVAAASGFALGDPWIDVKVRLWGKERGAQVALSGVLTVPASLATADSFGGDANVTVAGNLLFGWEGERWRAGVVGGFLYRPNESHFFSTTIGNQILYAAAFAYDVLDHRRFTLLGELHGHTDVSATCPSNNPNCTNGIDDIDANPLEFDLAGKARLTRGLFGTIGVGTGIVRGVGSPQVRVLAGVTYSPDRRDRDHDGVPDIDDKCPDVAEDRDGFQDDDGCPDPDNDGDGIPDDKDKCPNQAEDFDQFQDEDGCPEPDNDGDGIPDIKDACPLDKEDGKPPKPNDGCPIDKTDSDGDGIMDNVDKCPNEPEDKDGFEDADGCPDVDNDQDGIPDQYDKCPNDPEDKDGFEDDDGCPDPDNDHDGILDKDDKCPNEPETINGYKDEDGCPDNGPPPKVQIVGDEIVILEKVYFDTNKASIKSKSFNLLDQVAQTIRAHSEIKKVSIEGHTDAQGDHGKNMKLSQDRAESVRAYLIKRAVAPERLEAHGFGPDRPVSDNKTSKGREANRRVEFHIVERAAQTKPAPDAPPAQGQQE